MPFSTIANVSGVYRVLMIFLIINISSKSANGIPFKYHSIPFNTVRYRSVPFNTIDTSKVNFAMVL